MSLHLISTIWNLISRFVSLARCRKEHTPCFLGGKYHLGSHWWHWKAKGTLENSGMAGQNFVQLLIRKENSIFYNGGEIVELDVYILLLCRFLVDHGEVHWHLRTANHILKRCVNYFNLTLFLWWELVNNRNQAIEIS
jgi:hypothetical protein